MLFSLGDSDDQDSKQKNTQGIAAIAFSNFASNTKRI